jgi:hypothetical protein
MSPLPGDAIGATAFILIRAQGEPSVRVVAPNLAPEHDHMTGSLSDRLDQNGTCEDAGPEACNVGRE